MTARRGTWAAALLAVAVAGVGASGAAADGPRLPRGSEPVTLNPADFTTRIDNPYWPMRPGGRWVYRETTPDGTRQRVVVTVTRRTKLIANGVTARVVHDVVTEGGAPVEVTDDYYAQDRAGNIWYLGDATTEFVNGEPVSTAGSFEAGVDGAQYSPGQAEDRASVVSLADQVEVPFGHFRAGRVLTTRETNPLEPKVLELKFYARGVGPALAIGVSGGADREELLSYTRG